MSELVQAQRQWHDRNGWPLDLNAVYAENEFKGDSGEDLVSAQRRYMEHLDGGAGSGNWGHSGRPGYRGGSGAGGGVAYRLTTPSGEYTGLVGAYKENEKHTGAHGGGGGSKADYGTLRKRRDEANVKVKDMASRFSTSEGQKREEVLKEYQDAKKKKDAITKEMFKTVDDCKDVQDVSDFMSAQGYFREGISSGTGLYQSFTGEPFEVQRDTSVLGNEIDLSGVSFEGAKNVVRAYDRVFETYPELKGQLDGVAVANLGRRTFAQCAVPSGDRIGGMIQLNKAFFRDHDTIEKAKEYDVRKGYGAETGRASAEEAIVTHELGHALDSYISKKYTNHKNYDPGRKRDNKTKQDNFGSDALEYARKTMKEKYKSDVQKSVSEYATSNPYEFFAESFANGVLSDNPKPASKAVLEYIRKTMRGE